MKYLTLILVIYSNLFFCQQAEIKFKNLELLEDKTMLFEINGIKIEPNKKTYKIPISNNIDTIFFYYNYTKSDKKIQSFAKFKKNKNYIIRINMCSGYELYPEQKAKTGKIKIIDTKIDRNKSVSFCAEEIILNKKKSKYEKCHPSAMCRFSYQKIDLIEKYDEILDSFNFHFLHGERLNLKINESRILFNVK
ncbi:hypothetical protein [Tenacibaculum soleae]|uniref:hypothetical protein n=1 Tax=Tenacibaculum soleae TaxID=447689 RepID=UPI0026E3DEDF|nr:hypothetical protein [Tenacibaculum soleae]MDO6814010.1 hypothetical protein [Tenacibaculum soleae]